MITHTLDSIITKPEDAALRIAAQRCENTDYYLSDMPDVQLTPKGDKIEASVNIACDMITPAGTWSTVSSVFTFTMRPAGHSFVEDHMALMEALRQTEPITMEPFAARHIPLGARSLSKAKYNIFIVGTREAVLNQIATHYHKENSLYERWEITFVGITRNNEFSVILTAPVRYIKGKQITVNGKPITQVEEESLSMLSKDELIAAMRDSFPVNKANSWNRISLTNLREWYVEYVLRAGKDNQ